MSETTLSPDQPTAAPLPRMTDADIQSARDRIQGYLKESLELGVTLRPITGQAMRLAARAGLDLESLGRADDPDLSDEDYFDQVTVAFWLLGAPIDEVIACIDSDPDGIGLAAVAWSLRQLPSYRHERAALRAFIARWLEYRIEMQALLQAEATEA